MSKAPVLLLPALLCNDGIFINQIHSLQPVADFTVPDLGTADNIADLASDILKKAPEHFALGGISMGGYVAFEILRQAPERVLSLLLMDTNVTADSDEKKERRLKLIDLAHKNGIESVVPFVLSNVVAPEFRQLPQLQRFFTFMAQALGTTVFENEQKVIMSRQDSTELLSEIDCPTFVIGGQKDDITPPESMKNLAENIKEASYRTILNSGHLPPLENPNAVTTVMRSWLNSI